MKEFYFRVVAWLLSCAAFVSSTLWVELGSILVQFRNEKKRPRRGNAHWHSNGFASGPTKISFTTVAGHFGLLKRSLIFNGEISMNETRKVLLRRRAVWKQKSFSVWHAFKTIPSSTLRVFLGQQLGKTVSNEEKQSRQSEVQLWNRSEKVKLNRHSNGTVRSKGNKVRKT